MRLTPAMVCQVICDQAQGHGPGTLPFEDLPTENAKPLTADAVEALRIAKARASGSGKVFDTMPCHKTMNADLERAGIPKHDARGRSLSFHGLRKTFATNAARFGVSQRVTQEAMRHTDPKITANFYQDAQILPLAEELRKIPMLRDLVGGKDGDGEKKVNDELASQGKMTDTQGVEVANDSHPPNHADRNPGPRRDIGRLQHPPASQGLGLHQRADGVPDVSGPCITLSISMTPAGIEPAGDILRQLVALFGQGTAGLSGAQHVTASPQSSPRTPPR
jgi:hypothetical protein